MLTCQRELFSFPEDITYLNCAYLSPLLKAVEQAGHRGVSQKARPFEVFAHDFFEPTDRVRKLFSELINVPDFRRIAVLPSVSYGIANVVKNIKVEKGQKIILVDEQFPSNYYSWKRLADEKGVKLVMVKPNSGSQNRGESWNEKILQSIDSETVAVTMPNVHWADGTKFDLKAIREKSRKFGAKLIIDGTQSVGALPLDVSEIQPDALICSGYKWLFGPYGIGLGYFGETFDNGIPIEESWMNRKDSEDFRGLVNYKDEYRPKAGRYNVGETSNFITLPMMEAALAQIKNWGIQNIQDYCKNLTGKYVSEFREMGCQVESSKYRGHHLFGVRLTDNFDVEELKNQFSKQKIFVSFRGNAIRIALHVCNNEDDMDKLVSCFENARKKVLA